MTLDPASSNHALLDSLRAAVKAAPDDAALRLHLAELLVTHNQAADAIGHAIVVLQGDPTNAAAARVISAAQAAATAVPAPAPQHLDHAAQSDTDILAQLDSQLTDIVAPPYLPEDPSSSPAQAPELETVRMRLADVAGMIDVKTRLEAALLAPMRNPELLRLYGKSLRGGLLLYGPPGCGKTFIARAVAGEMGASFLAITLADVLDMYIGQSERNVREIFELARRSAPCVVFFDEVDALGQKRSMRSHARGSVTQMLSELDGIADNNEGVFVLGATNHPWDVDVALRRPGRFDRMLFVAPPDEAAREGVLRYHLRQRPVSAIDTRKLAKLTDGYSGADLAYVCETAAEQALLSSAQTGTVRMIDMNDLRRAITDVRPSIGPWLDTARNVAQFSNASGTYDELLAYLRKRKLL